MKINHRETSFLIDTGAVASCVSEQFAKSLKLKPQPSEQTIALTAANGSKIESLGVIDVELSIQGLTVPFTFFVLRSLSHKAILGNDFLQESGAVIDCAKHSITLYDGLVQAVLSTARDRYFVLSLVHDVVIPAATEAIVKLFVPTRFRYKTSVLETFEPIKNRFLMVAGALVHPTTNYSICRVCNIGNTPRRLKAHCTHIRVRFE